MRRHGRREARRALRRAIRPADGSPLEGHAARESGWPRLLAGDVKGGIATAIVDLGLLLTYGLLAFGALGAGHLEHGVLAAFASSIVGGLVATLLGSAAIPGTGPRASSTLILATFVAALVGGAPGSAGGLPTVEAVLFLAAACVTLAGAIQLVLAGARLGSLVKFVPYPVVSGFMNGVAILIVLSQLPNLLGFPGPLTTAGLREALEAAQPWTVFIGLATAAVVWLVSWRWRRLPAALVGVVAGALLYHVVAASVPSAPLGPLLEPVAGRLPPPTALAPLASDAGWALVRTHWTSLVGTAFVIAIVGTLESLLAAAGADAAHGTRHDSNRELVGQGWGNVVSGLLGGLPITFSQARAGAAFRAGARTRRSGVVTPVVLLVFLEFGSGALGLVPIAALAGIMLTVAAGLVDRWSSQLARELALGNHGREAPRNLAVVLLVCVVAVAFNLVLAVLVGVIASMALFIAAMNRSLVRASWTGMQRSSRRVYPLVHARRLEALGRSIRVLELEGALFFGTAERLSREVDRRAGDARFVILDFKRVGTVDATGALLLERISRRLAANGVHLFLAGVTPDGRHGRALLESGAFQGGPRADWFEDVDRALEAAERALLEERAEGAGEREVPLEASSLLAGLAPAQIARVRGHFERHELRAGELLCREGEPGDRLYVLTRGSVSILAGARGGAQRIVTMEPGVVFGEMAMLDGAPRSATAVADEPAEVFSLSAADLERIRTDDPELGLCLLRNLARHLSMRLRLTTDALRAEADLGD